MKILKSIGAGLAGIVIGAALSIGTDTVLQNAGVIPKDNLWVSAALIWLVLGYRLVYNVLGCYVTARLAPSNPMKHAIVLGAFGTLVSALGAFATKDMHLGPMWYPWTLAALSLPSAWVGGWLYVRGMPPAAPAPLSAPKA